MILVTKLIAYHNAKLLPAGVTDRSMAIGAVLAAATEDVQQEAANKVTALLAPYVAKPFVVKIPNPAAVYPSLANFLAQCAVSLDGSTLGAPGKEALIKALTQVDAEIAGRDIIKVFGRASATKQQPFISEKFDSDHLTQSTNAERTTAQGRLYRPMPAPASTSINRSDSAAALNGHVKALNDAGVFNAVVHHMRTVFSWNPEASTVDSIIYITPMEMTSRTYTKKPSGAASRALNLTEGKGHLAFAAQEDGSIAGRYLLYHYHDIIPTANIDTPKKFKDPQRGEWAALPIDDVIRSLEKLNQGGKQRVTPDQVAKLRSAYFRVYYAKL